MKYIILCLILITACTQPPPENTVVKIECDKGVPRLVVSDGKNLYYVPVQDAQGFYECGE